jgi:PAS domain S-box-containing protein
MVTDAQAVDRSRGLKAEAKPSSLKYFIVGFLASAGYFLGVKLGLALTFGPHPVSVLWPPNAIVLAILLMIPVRQWWGVLLMVFPAHLAAEAQGGVPMPMVLAWYISNCSEALIGAGMTRFFIGEDVRLDRLRDIIIFLFCGAFFSTFASSFLDAGFVTLNHWGHDSYWQVWRMRVFSNVFASVTIVPAIVGWKGVSPRAFRISTARAVEAGFLLGGLTTVILLMFFWLETGSGLVPVLLAAPLPFFLWASIRFGVRGTSVTILLGAFLAIWSGVYARGPFMSGSPEENAVSVQAFFILLAVTLLPLAAVLRERNTMNLVLSASERRYREVLESQGELVCRNLADMTITFANESFCRFFARPREALLGRRLLDLVSPAIHERILLNIARVMVSRRPLVCECEALIPDRDVAWQQWILHPIVSPDGHIREIQAVGRDISARKLVEEALRESEERYRAVVETQTELVCRYTPNTTLTFVNQAFCRFFHETRERLVSRRLTDLLPAGAREKMLHEVAWTLASRQSSSWEHAFTKGEDTIRWVRWNNYPITDANGQLEEIQAIGVDISDRKRAEEATRNLAHASRLAVVGELTAVIAHEVSQPINAILNNSEAAQAMVTGESIPRKQLEETLVDIHADTLRAAEAVRRIRAFSKRREMEMRALPINELVEDVLRLISGDASRRHVEIRSHLGGELPLVWGDFVCVQQVLLNLIINGMDAMNTTSDSERFLAVKTSRNGGSEIVVSVRDHGPGIAPELTTQIFQSFFSTKHEGIGLGLSIARSIVEAHGGRIWVENNPDRGATFSFTLRPYQANNSPEPK